MQARHYHAAGNAVFRGKHHRHPIGMKLESSDRRPFAYTVANRKADLWDQPTYTENLTAAVAGDAAVHIAFEYGILTQVDDRQTPRVNYMRDIDGIPSNPLDELRRHNLYNLDQEKLARRQALDFLKENWIDVKTVAEIFRNDGEMLERDLRKLVQATMPVIMYRQTRLEMLEELVEHRDLRILPSLQSDDFANFHFDCAKTFDASNTGVILQFRWDGEVRYSRQADFTEDRHAAGVLYHFLDEAGGYAHRSYLSPGPAKQLLLLGAKPVECRGDDEEFAHFTDWTAREARNKTIDDINRKIGNGQTINNVIKAAKNPGKARPK